MNEIIKFFTEASIAELIPIGASIIIVSVIFVVWASVIERDPMRSRVKAMTTHRDQIRARQRHTQVGGKTRRPFQQKSLFSRVAADLRRARGAQAAKSRFTLAQAGWRSNEALGVYVMVRTISPLVWVVGALILTYTVPAIAEKSQLMKLGVFVLCTVAGFKAPDYVLGRIAKSRQTKLERGLPDALDLMVVCTEAGLGLDSAFDRVAGEIVESHPELSDELTLTSVELNILPQRQEALTNFLNRTGVSAIESVVSTLSQTERYGTPLSQSFRVLASDFRDQRMLKAEEKAARLPATLTIPMVLFIMPCLFGVLLGPAIIQSMAAF
ncbi:type II secretion system F family protein [Iodidimonas sp. SYSU 1G8]|uniref:type II secretion system F family protein n=1 Tax=Iodidimonas sp. SYSU 1G8 TaxID=3133967 RepID=UPI0031FF2737